MSPASNIFVSPTQFHTPPTCRLTLFSPSASAISAISARHQARTVRRISPSSRWPCAARRPTCSSCVRPTAMRYTIALCPPLPFLSCLSSASVSSGSAPCWVVALSVHVSCTCSSVNPSSRVYQNCVGRVSNEEHTKISGIFSLTSCGTLFHR